MSRVALLDVNVLVALFDPDHIHHELAHDWFADERAAGWATCPLTENGFTRILSNPRYGSPATGASELVARLRVLCASGHHVFWADSVSHRDDSIFNAGFIRGHRQISDIYLLGLARKMGGLLATFDRAIPIGAVVGATRDDIAVIADGGAGD